jgi:putative nucleotidyltransferase with HDIG domain
MGYNPAMRTGRGTQAAGGASHAPSQHDRLPRAFQRLDGLPALAESRDRLLRVLLSERPSRGAIIATIEADLALAIGVLRVANRRRFVRKGGVATIREAVEALTPAGVEVLARRIGAFDFFEQVPGWEIRPDSLRLHATATAEVAHRLGAELGHADRDELRVAALLHDIGKLVLAEAFPGYPDAVHGAAATPELRLRAERRKLGLDHAMVGGVLIRRWGLPARLADAVSHHHDPEAEGNAALIGLADMLVNYTQGRPVEPGRLAETAQRVGLGERSLRSLMYELPGLKPNERRRADPCPLSRAELGVLRTLAEGKTYKEIAAESGRARSTVRSHLHSIYGKLGVNDRAQAVLLAAEKDWL